MYTKFYDNTIETKFIKQLVATTNVPFMNVWREGDFVVRGLHYIYNGNIWICNHTGYPSSILDKCEVRADLIRDIDGNYLGYVQKPKNAWSNHIPSSHTEQIPYFTIISPFIYGESYHNLTDRYSSHQLGYDSKTHFYLGLYLRCLRDLYYLDLMPFYNCYCGETLSNVDFDSEGNVRQTKTPDLYKIFSVPVKFGKTYTIAIDSDTKVETILAIYNDKGLLESQTLNLNNIVGQVGEDVYGLGSTYKSFLRTSFNRPILLHTKSWHLLYDYYVKEGNVYLDDNKILTDDRYDLSLGQYERYLKLLIKVPKTNKSSLVVIEGDYNLGQTQEVQNSDRVTFNNLTGVDMSINSSTVSGDIVEPDYYGNYRVPKDYNYESSSYSDIEVENNVSSGQISTEWINESKDSDYVKKVARNFSTVGLLLINTGNSYAFSNRLIEYLLQHVITHLDTFTDNTRRIQEYASSTINLEKNGSKYKSTFVPGVWDESLKQYLFELATDSLFVKSRADLTGYVDKDTELVITRGQKV